MYLHHAADGARERVPAVERDVLGSRDLTRRPVHVGEHLPALSKIVLDVEDHSDPVASQVAGRVQRSCDAQQDRATGVVAGEGRADRPQRSGPREVETVEVPEQSVGAVRHVDGPQQ